MACERYIDLIFSKIDGEISAEDNAELSAHLLKCPECRAEYDELMRLEHTLKNIPKYDVPETFAGAVTDKIRVNPKGKKKRGYKPYFSLAAACVVVVVMLCFYAFDGRLSEGDKLIDTRQARAVQESDNLSETQEYSVATEGEEVLYDASYEEDAESAEGEKQSRTFFMERSSSENEEKGYGYAVNDAAAQAGEEMVEAAPRVAMMLPAQENVNRDSEYSLVANLSIAEGDLYEILSGLTYIEKDRYVYEMDTQSFNTLSERVNKKGLDLSYENQNPDSSLVLIIVSVK